MNTDKAIIVFAKEPKEGRVKTRLQKNLSSKDTLNFYKAFVSDVLSVIKKVSDAQAFLFYSGVRQSMPFLKRFSKNFLMCQQRGEDLGMRMFNAFVRSSRGGFTKTIIIGTDCLSITPEDIQKAFNQLEHYDCVLGPTLDGGYYLIGLKTADCRVFQNVRWSSEDVLTQTICNLKKTQKTYFLLEKKEDIDEIEDIVRLSQNKMLRSTLKYTDKVFRKVLKLG